ncbi:cylicin-2-like isoform X1 [Megalobrama amblycephala]|uniref:cylicin-2-like isoform X1 n=1 Tax=Megalobrama amblycephala TaxID=75352 RepID=UPI002013DBAC|nr:cylicin-2-like isoform X1 [Megalobrama amblycephala]
MVYARAVWVENGKQMEGVLPLNWIDTETKVVRWPLKNVSVAHKRLLQPQEDWLSFEFVKVKVTSVSRQECEKYNYTSAQTEEEDTVSQKRMKKRRKFEDYVQGSDLSPEEDESLPDKKKEDTVLLPVPPPKGQNAMLLELPAPPELANTTIRQPESPASSDISGCSCPTHHRSPTRSESLEAFSPESARSRLSRTPQRGVRKPSQSGSRKSRASSSRSMGSCTPQRGVRKPSQSGSRKSRASSSRSRRSRTPQRGVQKPSQSGSRKSRASSSRSMGSRTPQRGVRKPSQSGSRKSRASSSRSRRSRTPQRGVRKPSQSGSRKGRASSSRSRRSRTPQRGVQMPSQSERGLFPMSQAKYQKSVLGKLVELLDEIKRVGRHYEPLNSAVHVARLETFEDFAEEEARLKERNLWEQRVSQLSKVGGRNNKDCVHKVMDRLFTNSLMATFNMKGRGRSEKKAFQDTVLYSVVKAAVMKWSKTATEVEIRAAMAETLKHAPGRAGGGGRKV